MDKTSLETRAVIARVCCLSLIQFHHTEYALNNRKSKAELDVTVNINLYTHTHERTHTHSHTHTHIHTFAPIDIHSYTSKHIHSASTSV